MYQINHKKSGSYKSQSQLHTASRKASVASLSKGTKLRGDPNSRTKPTLKASPKRQQDTTQIVSSFLSETLKKLKDSNKLERKPLGKSQKNIRRGKSLDKTKHRKQAQERKISQVASLLESLLSQKLSKKKLKKRKAPKPQKINPERSVKMEVAAIKIQRWFRSLLKQPFFTIEIKTPCLNLCRSESENETETIEETIEESKLVEHFRRILNEKQREIEDKYEVKENTSNSPVIEPEIESAIAIDVYPEVEYCTTKGGLQIPKLRLNTEEIAYEDSASSLDPDQEFDSEESSDVQNCDSDSNSELELDPDSDTLSFHEYSDESMAEVPVFNIQSPLQQGKDLTSEDEPYLLSSSSESSFDLLGDLQGNYLAETEKIDELVQKEIKNFLGLVNFEIKTQQVYPEFSFLKKCLDFLKDLLTKEEENFLENFNTPLYINPKDKLLELRKEEAIIQVPKFELILHPIAIEIMKDTFNQEDLYTRSCYLQMIFDCTNEALNYVRPYGILGVPMPWSLKSPVITGESSIEHIFKNAEKILKKWAGVELGKDETEYALEEALSNMLLLELTNWDEYEEEEAQVSIQTADLVLDSLVEELIFILN